MRVADRVQLDAAQPWPGLEAYPETGRAFFHGRGEEIERLLALVEAHALVLLYGESGLGKTSLLQAGVFPRLRERQVLPVMVRLDHSPGAAPLGAQVLSSLSAALDAARIDGPRPVDGDRLWEYVHRVDTLLWSPAQELVQPLIVFDQFEELFTLGGGLARPSVSDFVDEIAELVLDRPPVQASARNASYDRSRPTPHVLFSFREEFLAEVEELLPQFGTQLQRRLRLGPLSVERATEAVQRAGGELVSATVARQIAATVSGGRATVEPSLLSVYCRELNLRRIEAGHATITSQLVRDVGATVLPAFYARSVEDVPAEVLAFVEERLLTEGGRRNIVTLEEAQSVPGVTRLALEQLVARRIIRIEERFGADRVELTHDVLAPVVAESRKRRREVAAQARLSRELEEQRAETARVDGERRRWRRLTGAAVALAVVALGSLVAAAVQTAQARRASAQAAESERTALAAGDSTLRALSRAAAAESIALRARDSARMAALDAASALSRMQSTERLRLVQQSDAFLTAVGFSTTLKDSIGRLAAAVEIAPEPGPASSGLLLALSALVPPQQMVAHLAPSSDAVFSGNAEFVLTRLVDVGQVWNVRTGAAVGSPNRRTFNDNAGLFSPNGAWVLAGAGERAVQVLDVVSGASIAPPMMHGGRVLAATFSRDGTRVLTASSDSTARLWDAQSGTELLRPIRLDDGVKWVRLTADGTQLVTTSREGRVRVWDASTGSRVRMGFEQGPPAPSFIASTADGMRWATASLGAITASGIVVDSVARLWDGRTGAPLGPPLRHDHAVGDLAFSPDGRWLATASFDKTARLWDALTGIGKGGPLRHAAAVVSVAFSPDGEQVVTASADGTARVWNVQTGSPVTEPLRHNAGVRTARFSADGKLVVTASADSTTRVWSARSSVPQAAMIRPQLYPRTAVLAPDGMRMTTVSGSSFRSVTAGPRLSKAHIWDLRSGRSVAQLDEGEPGMVEYSPDGRLLLIVSASEHHAQLWNAATGISVGPRLQHRDDIRTARFSSDGRRVITASADSTARIWDARTGTPVGRPFRHRARVTFADFSPDGKRVVTMADNRQVHVWDSRSGSSQLPPLPHQSAPVDGAFSPDGATVLTISDGSAQLWDAHTGAKGPTIEHRILAARFSPDGTMLVTSGMEGWARVWSTRTGAPLGPILRHAARVSSAEFSPDGARVVTASNDRTVRVWDVRSGVPLSPPLRSDEEVRMATFSSDGTRVFGLTRSVRLWDVRQISPPQRQALVDLAEVLIGGRMWSALHFRPISAVDQANRLAAWRRRAASWANAPDGSFEQWVHWYFSDPTTRPDQPGLWRSTP